MVTLPASLGTLNRPAVLAIQPDCDGFVTVVSLPLNVLALNVLAAKDL